LPRLGPSSMTVSTTSRPRACSDMPMTYSRNQVEPGHALRGLRIAHA
jgi:hypothetical protein